MAKKETLAALGIATALNACSGAVTVDERTIIYSNPNVAANPTMQAHEACHQQQMKDMGGADKFWKKYGEDPQFRCEAERACGADGEHFACKK